MFKERQPQTEQSGKILRLALENFAEVRLGLFGVFQPLSADQLFARINANTDANDDESMNSVRPQIDAFLERFPNDQRSAELQLIADEQDLSRATDRLRRRAAQRKDSLSAMDQAFLDCLDARQLNFNEFQRKLKAFIVVYGKLDGLTKSERRIVELAKSAEKIQSVPRLEIAPATIQLEKLIRSAESDLNGKELLSFYDSLLELYNGKPWAAEQLTRIRNRINSDAANGR